MPFNDTLPLQVLDLEKRVNVNNRKITELYMKMRAERHECDCEYCDYEDPFDSVDEEEVEKEVAGIKQENEVIEDTLRRLRLYAKDHNIRLTGIKKQG